MEALWTAFQNSWALQILLAFIVLYWLPTWIADSTVNNAIRKSNKSK